MRMGIIAFSALAAGCVTQKQLYLPDGRQGFAIACSGTALTWGDCFERAGSICGASGYDTFTQNSETGQILTANPTMLTGAPLITRSMVIGCKPAKDQ